MSNIFFNYSKLTFLNLSKFNINNDTNIRDMFSEINKNCNLILMIIKLEIFNIFYLNCF